MRKSLLVVLVIAALMPAAPGASSAGELRSFVRGSWSEIRRSHGERPTVVHLWGLTCAPCRVEMPHWGKLLQERRDLDLVTINADLVPNESSAVSDMLNRTGLGGAENWIFDGFAERLRYEIDPQWRGQIPLTLLMSRDGTTTTIEGVADLDMIRAWLDAQLETPMNKGAHRQ